jgi:hypothetical protein
MFNNFVFLTRVDVTDKKFTKKRTDDWKLHMLDSYDDVFCVFKEKIDPISPIRFFVSKSLIEEIIVDAVIGLRKITNNSLHQVEFPNTFKIAAYLAYWWLRHKPVSIHYPSEFFLEETTIINTEGLSKEDAEKERQLYIWRLKHINELVAVQIVANFIFQFDQAVCKNKECKRIKKANKNFRFQDFEEMKSTILQKLTYYFSYRPITPKVIEHILEGYTFHPAWNFTGDHWNVESMPEEE